MMLYLSEAERQIAQKILRFYIPDRRAVVFGSRASGIRLKPYSDILEHNHEISCPR
jgi:predicted nucleotidyltransferase